MLCLTLKIKKNQRPRILLYTPNWHWGQPYSSMNSAKLSWKSEDTLYYIGKCCFATLLFQYGTYKRDIKDCAKTSATFSAKSFSDIYKAEAICFSKFLLQNVKMHYVPSFRANTMLKRNLRSGILITVRAPLQPAAAVCIFYTPFLMVKNVFSRRFFSENSAFMYG